MMVLVFLADALVKIAVSNCPVMGVLNIDSPPGQNVRVLTGKSAITDTPAFFKISLELISTIYLRRGTVGSELMK